MGVVLIYAFLRRSSKVPDFYSENLATNHLTFVAEIRHHLPQVTQTVTLTLEGGEQVYIHTSCTMQEHRAGK